MSSPATTRLHMCMFHAHRSRMAQATTLKSLRTKFGSRFKTKQLQLKPKPRSGRVTVSGYSHLFWTRGGAVTEDAAIDDSGEFNYQFVHGTDEHVILVGSAPLYVASAQPVDGELTIEPAIASIHDLRLSLGPRNPQKSAIVALWLAGVRIPNQALAMHQMRHHQPWWIKDGSALVIPQLPTAYGIAVAQGPDPSLLPSNGNINDLGLFFGRALHPVSGGEFVFE